MALIFGFDIGTTSIGFAAIEYEPATAVGRILRLGVRIFPEARDPKGTPLNQARREKRMMRRQLRRRRLRRRNLNTALCDAGLLPSFGSPEWDILMRSDPIELRSNGLDRPLTPTELGRAIYHLSKRRHFRGKDLEESETGETLEGGAEQAADEKAAKTERASTIQALKATGHTLGQHLAARGPGIKQRGVHALRSHVEAEFDKLWDKQTPHHPSLSDPVFRASIRDLIFAQFPVFWRLNTLGECRLEPGADLAPKGSWLSAQRRMLEKLNNLEIAGGNARPLDQEERAAILERLQTQQSMTWQGARLALASLYKARDESTRSLKFNLELGGEPKLLGNAVEAKLAKIFGDSWDQHPHKSAIRDAAHHRLWNADYGKIGEQRVVIKRAVERAADRRDAARTFGNDFGATPGQVAELAKLSFPTGWDAFSTAALGRLLPELEAGRKMGQLLASPEFAKWRGETFPNRDQATGEVYDKLPSPKQKEESDRIKTLRNPTVVRTQNELRKVTNNLIDFCGRKPDLIRVELARDVGKGKFEREEISKAIRSQTLRRKDAEKQLESNGMAEPRDRDIEKYLLWKECQERDPYTGDHIGFTELFQDGTYEVEHIWPRSKSFDDSFRNKTLCRKDINLAKGDRIPFEYFRDRPEAWEACKDLLQKLTSTKAGEGLSRGKVKRFLAESMPDDFASRQLNDTGYAGRQAVDFLKRLWPDLGPTAPVNVQTVSGRVTAHLRRLWSLNHILGDTGEKNRADHRHHAIDALVVACTHPGVTQALSRYWQLKDDPRQAGTEKPRLDPPWPNIRADADTAAQQIVVSHRVRKKVSGPLHKETVYGDTGNDVTTKTGTYREFVRRKKVEVLTKDEYNEIRDPRIRDIMTGWLAEQGGDPKKIKWTSYPRLGGNGPEIRRVRILTRQQLSLMVPVSTGFADPGSNHHIAIYVGAGGKAEFEVVTLFEAARRLAKREPIVRRTRPGSRFVMSLSTGDAVEFPVGHAKAGIKIVQGVWASGVVVMHDQRDAMGKSVEYPRGGTLPSAQARKINIDPIGRIRPAND